MRQTFINTLTKLAERDQRIYLLTADLGFSFLEKFAQKFPERFLNCGVAEQNMLGVAAGLALSGKKVYVYSIIPFVTMRCFEQIRNDICYQNCDVKIIGVGPGFSYGPLGTTHHSIEDLAILRALPNMTVLSPADPIETKALTIESYKTKNPTYLRLDRGGKEILYQSRPKILIGKPTVLKEGKEGAIITTGAYLKTGITLIKKLQGQGYDLKLISMHTLKPIDKKALVDAIRETKLIFTLEEHNIIGGLGSAVAEILFDFNLGNRVLKRIGVADQYADVIGEQNYIRKHYKIDPESIYRKIIAYLKVRKKLLKDHNPSLLAKISMLRGSAKSLFKSP